MIPDNVLVSRDSREPTRSKLARGAADPVMVAARNEPVEYESLDDDVQSERRHAMALLCVCGARMPYLFDTLDCLTCGRACCPDCAVLLESAWYCARCAASLLEAAHPAVGSEGGP